MITKLPVRTTLALLVGTTGCLSLASCGGRPEAADPAPGQATAATLPTHLSQAVANGTLSENERDTVLEKGRQAAKALVDSLLNAQLKAAMEAGGPTNAIQVCQQVAQPMTASTASAFEGVTIRRTSLRVRNPANAPDPIDRELLEAWQAGHSAGDLLPPEDVILDGSMARYYAPITVKALCLNCHGKRAELEPQVTAMLDKYYPDDQAHGYSEGDFRGAVRVDVALAARNQATD